MISYIIGNVAQIGDNYIVLDNNGIGYFILMPMSSLSRIGANEGEVKVYTYMAVREDDVSLFGFLSKGELEMFKLLIQVSGVGPKGALGILSSIGVDELKMAIAADDAKLISGAKGIGSKTAQKIVVELKGKIEKEVYISSANQTSSAQIKSASVSSEALDVLEALGFSRSSGMKALSQIEISDNMNASDIVSKALEIIE